MKAPLCIDLFCGAGGCSVGYHRAGYRVIGVDIKPQKRYPFEFIQDDIFEVWDSLPHDEVALYHASPPCQKYSVMQSIQGNEHPDLIDDVRELLQSTGKPYVIENVVGAPLIEPLMLCGSMFGLHVLRHRLFECCPGIVFAPALCNHDGGVAHAALTDNGNRVQSQFGLGYKYISVVGHSFKARDGALAMGIDWMTRDELAQAIPPAYTEYIGKQMLALTEER